MSKKYENYPEMRPFKPTERSRMGGWACQPIHRNATDRLLERLDPPLKCEPPRHFDVYSQYLLTTIPERDTARARLPSPVFATACTLLCSCDDCNSDINPVLFKRHRSGRWVEERSCRRTDIPLRQPTEWYPVEGNHPDAGERERH